MKRAKRSMGRAAVWLLCAALGPSVPAAADESVPDPARVAFEAFARAIGEFRGEAPEALWELDLDGDKKLERVAVLCSTPDFAAHGGWVIEAEGPRRFFVAFDDLDGRSALPPCGEGHPKPAWSRPGRAYLEYRQGHHGGGDQYRVALRDGRPVVIWNRSVNDVRAGDLPETLDWDKRVKARSDLAFPDVNTIVSGGAVYGIAWTPNVETAFATLAALGRPEEPPATPDEKVLRTSWEARAAGWRTTARYAALRTAGLVSARARLAFVRIEEPKPKNPSWVRAAFETRLRIAPADAARLRTGTVETGYVNGVISLCFDKLEAQRARLGDRFVAAACESNSRGTYLYLDEGK